jgi:hypothetical protein
VPVVYVPYAGVDLLDTFLSDPMDLAVQCFRFAADLVEHRVQRNNPRRVNPFDFGIYGLDP